jgi:hypothetical protein
MPASQPTKPTQYATKDVWAAYAATQGMSAADANAMTKKDLVAKFGDPKSATDRGPNPAHVLLTAIRDAIDAGVPAATVVPMINMALGATGSSQAPGWRMVSGALDMATAAAKPAEGVQTEVKPATS